MVSAGPCRKRTRCFIFRGAKGLGTCWLSPWLCAETMFSYLSENEFIFQGERRSVVFDIQASAQRIAMKAIIGCFRTTSTPALEVETALPSAHIKLQSKILRTFTRMQTLPKGNPVSFCMERAIRSKATGSSLTWNIFVISQNTPPPRWRRYAHSYDRHGGRHPSRSISRIARKMLKYTTTKPHMIKIQFASTQTVLELRDK